MGTWEGPLGAPDVGGPVPLSDKATHVQENQRESLRKSGRRPFSPRETGQEELKSVSAVVVLDGVKPGQKSPRPTRTRDASRRHREGIAELSLC